MLYNFNYYPESLKNSKKKLSEKPNIHPTANIVNSRFGSWSEVGINSRYFDSQLDDYSYDDGNVIITYTEIGKFCSIASHVRINPVNHPKERVTQHHMTYRRNQFGFSEIDDKAFFDYRKSKSCYVGADAWIGHAAIIMPGVKVGIGAIIGSGSVVTKDIGDYEIAVGVPAKVIKKRFPDETIKKLLQTEWWKWSREEIEKRFDDFYDIGVFLEKY